VNKSYRILWDIVPEVSFSDTILRHKIKKNHDSLFMISIVNLMVLPKLVSLSVLQGVKNGNILEMCWFFKSNIYVIS
jgi:hypothetical protein